jgi:Skp family chaperone for outer membrane proteins
MVADIYFFRISYFLIRSFMLRMNLKTTFLPALLTGTLLAGALSLAAVGQAAPAAPAAAHTAPAAAPAAPSHVAPTAFAAKVALIAFQQAVITTNEGQRALADIRAKYTPKTAQLETLNNEIDALKKKAQAAPAGTTDAERSSLLKQIDSKQKQLDNETQDARTAYQTELQEAYSKVAQKVNGVLVKYVESNGYTLLLDVGNEQSNVMWAAHDPSADITQAVVDAYNLSTPGITAPPPEAPAPVQTAPAKPRAAAPATHAPAPAHVAPKTPAK